MKYPGTNSHVNASHDFSSKYRRAISQAKGVKLQRSCNSENPASYTVHSFHAALHSGLGKGLHPLDSMPSQMELASTYNPGCCWKKYSRTSVTLQCIYCGGLHFLYRRSDVCESISAKSQVCFRRCPWSLWLYSRLALSFPHHFVSIASMFITAKT